MHPMPDYSLIHKILAKVMVDYHYFSQRFVYQTIVWYGKDITLPESYQKFCILPS